MRFFALLLLLASGLNPLPAQDRTTVRLWQGRAPEARGDSDADIPSLALYPVKGRPAAAVVICPGGGYQVLASHEGEDYALFLNASGIAGFVLKYRLGSNGYRHPAMLQDAARAMRYVRSHAAALGVDPQRIGIMGSSAGGHLASTLLTHWDRGDPASSDSIEKVSSRPDFGILCYPVISMGEIGHSGSRRNLLGENPPPDLVRLLSNELHVSPQTPPCFLWHTFMDNVVPVENTLEFAAALRRNGVPFDLHVYQDGGHGMGLTDKSPFANVHPWARDLVFWLKARGLSPR